MKLKDTPLRGAVPVGGFVIISEPIPGMPGKSDFAKVAPTSIGGLDDAPSDGKAYGRLNATWTQVLPIGGGTLTGGLIAPNVTVTGSILTLGGNAIANPNIIINGTVSSRAIRFQTAGSQRWSVVADNTAEGGANAGSNFTINRYSDGAAFIDTPMTISRQTGLVTVSAGLTATTGNIVATAGNGSFGGSKVFLEATNQRTIQWSSAALRYSIDGGTTTKFSISDSSGDVTITGNAIIGANAATAPIIQLNGAAGSNRRLIYQTAGVARWIAQVNNTAEGGSNAGSDYQLVPYNDAGAALPVAMSIARSSGLATFANGITSSAGNITANGGGNVSASNNLSATNAALADHVFAFRTGTYGGFVGSWASTSGAISGFRVNGATGTMEFGSSDGNGNMTAVNTTLALNGDFGTAGAVAATGPVTGSYFNSVGGAKLATSTGGHAVVFDYKTRVSVTLPSIIVDGSLELIICNVAPCQFFLGHRLIRDCILRLSTSARSMNIASRLRRNRKRCAAPFCRRSAPVAENRVFSSRAQCGIFNHYANGSTIKERVRQKKGRCASSLYAGKSPFARQPDVTLRAFPMAGKIFINYRHGDDPGNTGRLAMWHSTSLAPDSR